MKTIEIIVDNKGECTAQTKGFTGTACRDASKFIERALGVVQSDTPTAEMYQAQTNPQQAKAGN